MIKKEENIRLVLDSSFFFSCINFFQHETERTASLQGAAAWDINTVTSRTPAALVEMMVTCFCTKFMSESQFCSSARVFEGVEGFAVETN